MGAYDVASFLKRVVPWPADGEPGYINCHYTSPKFSGLPGRPFRTLVDFMGFVEWANMHPAYCKDIYFCTSRQLNVGKVINKRPYAMRNMKNTDAQKSVFIDIDVKKPPKGYPNVVEALGRVKAFAAAEGLPFPTALVGSGWGLHCYWVSGRPLAIQEWTTYADGLEAAAKRFGLRHDSNVTVDCTRVLRVPGTFNLKDEKNPRPVKLLWLADKDCDFEKELGHIRAAQRVQRQSGELSRSNVRPVEEVCLLKPRETPSSVFTADLSSAEYQREIGTIRDELVDPAPSLRQCPFFRDAVKTGGKHHDQGLWMITGLATTFMKNGRAIFHAMSKGHADYQEANVDAMFDRKEDEKAEREIGWPSCQTIERYGSKHCAACPLRGSIRSPLNITGLVDKPPTAPEPVKAETQTLSGPTPADAPVPLPPNYFINPKGLVCLREVGFTAQGTEYPIETVIFKTPISNVHLDSKGLNFTVVTSKGMTDRVCFTRSHRISKQACATALNLQGAQICTNHQKVYEFMVDFTTHIGELNSARESVPYGWYKEGTQVVGWAYHDFIHLERGGTLPASSGDPRTRKNYTPCGDIEVWLRALKLVTGQHRPALEVIAAAAFASPLLHFTGQYSGALVGWSQSGGNKSTAVNVGASVWGNPLKTKYVQQSSNNSMRVKMAELNNMPCYWDDVSDDLYVERCAQQIRDVSQGADGSKLDHNREMRETGTWQAMMCVCSNRSMFDYMVSKNKTDAASIYRIFEFEVPDPDANTPGQIDDNDAALLVQELEVNFGNMGDRYTEWFLKNPTHMRGMVKAIRDSFEAEVGLKQGERFWAAMCSTILAGAHMANSIGGTFNYKEMRTFLVKAFQDMRAKIDEAGIVGSREVNSAAALTAFFKHCSDNTYRSFDMIKGKGGKHVKVNYIAGADFSQPIHVHWVINERCVRIARDEFEKFLRLNNYGPSMVISSLRKNYHMQTGFVNLVAGTNYEGGGQERILVIPVPEGSWLDEMLMAHSTAPLLGKGPKLVTHSDLTKAAPSEPESAS